MRDWYVIPFALTILIGIAIKSARFWAPPPWSKRARDNRLDKTANAIVLLGLSLLAAAEPGPSLHLWISGLVAGLAFSSLFVWFEPATEARRSV